MNSKSATLSRDEGLETQRQGCGSEPGSVAGDTADWSELEVLGIHQWTPACGASTSAGQVLATLRAAVSPHIPNTA